MDLTEVARALRRFWLLALAVLCVTVAAGYQSTNWRSARFEAATTLSVVPNPAVSGSADAVDYQLPIIVERITSRSFRRSLADAVGAEALDRGGSLSAVNDAGGIVRITARGPGRDAVAEVANAAATAIVEQYTPATGRDDPTADAGPVVVEVIDEAVPATGSGRPPAAPIALASGVLGAIAATGAAVLAQRWVRARDPAARLRDELGVPVLAVIPDVADQRLRDDELEHLVSAGPAPLSDALQDLRTRLEARIGEDGGVLAVTSWRRDPGRTTLTAALGHAFASVSRDVVLVDADLAQPGLHTRLGVAPTVGLSEVDGSPREPITHPTRHENLRFVAAGTARRHPAEVLKVALPAVLGDVTATSPHTVVVIDAPPLFSGRRPWVGIPAETATVLRATQLVLVVVGPGMNDVEKLATAVEQLSASGVIVVGAVLARRRRWSSR